jgi:RNA polymerase sigma-70 factor, ECF subfamily
MGRPADDPRSADLAGGRADAFAALYDEFGPALFRTARRLLGSPEEAEDAVQDVFVALVRARRDLAGVGNLRAYLFAALRRACADRAGRRARGRAMPIGSVPEPAAAEPPEAERSARLERARLALPPEQREVIALKIDGGLTFAEVAAVLGISPNTAASRYRYALERLRTALGE